MIYKLADAHSQNIGEATNIWHFCIVLKGTKIEKNCNFNAYTLLKNRVTIKSSVQIWDGNFAYEDCRCRRANSYICLIAA